jgi:hypothetical protein
MTVKLLCRERVGKSALVSFSGGLARRAVRLAVPGLALLAAGVICRAQNSNVVLTQTTLLAGFPNGGAFGSGTAAGTSMAVNSLGVVFLGTSYGGSLVELDGKTGVETSLGSYSNIGPVAVDPTNNLYIANVYSSTIVKLPYGSGGYATFSAPSSTTPVCTGADTAECTLASSAVSGPYGVASMTFDGKGDMFYSSTNGGSAGNAIFEISAAQLAASTPAATMIYQEPVSSSSPVLVGGMAVDPSGDLFFADAVFPDQANEESSSSNANELHYLGAGTNYNPTKTVLYTYTDATPANYDNLITSVGVKADGSTVYFATENDGIFGFPMNNGNVDTAMLYTFATQGAKVMTTDGVGNFYVSDYSSSTQGDALTHLGVNVLTVPQTNLGSSGDATNVSTIVSDITSCSSANVTYGATEAGSPTTEFSAATSGSCSTVSLSNASVIPTTITFSPTASGMRSAVITATDANSSSGSAAVSGIGVGSPAATPVFAPGAGAYTSIQLVTITDATPESTILYTTDGSTPAAKAKSTLVYTGPITVAGTETINAIATALGSGDSAVATATYTITLPAAIPNFGPSAGTYNAVQTVTLSDTTTGATIYYTTDGSTPTTSSTVYTAPLAVNASETIQAIATAPGYVTSPAGSAVYTINLPTFGVAINPGAMTIGASGGEVQANVVVTPQNTFDAAVIFTCAGLPAGATCNFTPATVTPNGTYPVTTVLQVTTAGPTAKLNYGSSPFLPATVAAAACIFGWRRRRSFKTLMALFVLAIGLGMLSGCSNNNNSSLKTTTATVIVTATSGALVETGTLTLTVK